MVTEQSTKPSTTNQRPSSMLCGAAWQDQYIAEASVVALMMQMDAEFTKRTLRAPCGARVRRSLFSIFLIDADFAQGSGTDITGNITEVGRSNEPNPLIIGSPTRARTWDLRINSPSEKWPESRIQLGFPGFRLGNRLADFALVSPGSPPITLFQFPNPFSPVVLSDGLNFY